MTPNGIATISGDLARTGTHRTWLKRLADGFAAALLTTGQRYAVATASHPYQAPNEAHTSMDFGIAACVVAYYNAISSHDYRTAYNLWGATLHQRQSYNEFTVLASQTTGATVTILGTHASDNNTHEVTIKDTIRHRDGSLHSALGTYTIGYEGGTPKILAVSLQPDVTLQSTGAALTPGPSPSKRQAERAHTLGPKGALRAPFPQAQTTI